MFYNSEEVFVDKFLACIKKLGVDSIPFDNSLFYDGIEQMSQFFQIHRSDIGEISNEISLLFIKSPCEGNFSRFRNAISNQNGWYISFENPDYLNGILKITEDDAENILEETGLDISNEYLYEFAKAFCNGANIPIQ